MMLMNMKTTSGIFLLLFLAFPISIVSMDNEAQQSEPQGGSEPGQGGSSGSGPHQGGSSGSGQHQGGLTGSAPRQGGSSGSGRQQGGSSGSGPHQGESSGSGQRRGGSSRSRTNRDGRRFVLDPDAHHRRQNDLITRRPTAGIQQPVPLPSGPSQQRPRMWHPPASATLEGRLLPRPIAAPSQTDPRHAAPIELEAGREGGSSSRLTAAGGTPQPQVAQGSRGSKRQRDPTPALHVLSNPVTELTQEMHSIVSGAQQPAPQISSNPRPVHGGGGQISPVATNSDSSDDQGEWLLKALEEGEAESSNPQGSGGQINREEVPVIDLSSDDEEGQIPMDVNTSRLVPHSSGSGRLQPGPRGPRRTAGPHRGGSGGSRQGGTRVVPHAQHRRQQSNIIRQRPTAAAPSSVPAGGTHRQQQIPMTQPLDKADFRAFIQQMTAGNPSAGSGPAHQQPMPAAASSAIGTHHAAASRQRMPTNVPVLQQPAPQSRSNPRPAKVRRTHAGTRSSIPIRIQHIVPPTSTILNLNAEPADYRQIVQQHTGLGQSISNAIDLDSPTRANDGIATVSATGSDQHQRQSRPESRQLPVELEMIAPSALGARRGIFPNRLNVQRPVFHGHAAQMQTVPQQQQLLQTHQQLPLPIQLPQQTVSHAHFVPMQPVTQQLHPHLQPQTLTHGHLVPTQHHVGLRVVRDFMHASTSARIGYQDWPILDHNYWLMPAHDDSPMLPEEHWPTPADYELTEPQIPEEREIGIDERSVRYTAADRGKGILHEGGASTAAGHQGISSATLNVHYDAIPQPEEYHPIDPTSSFSHLHPDIHSQMPHTLMPNLSVSDASSAIRPSEGSTQEEIERSIDEGLEKLGAQFRAEEEQSHGQMSGQGSDHGHHEQQQQQGGFIGQTSDANVFEQSEAQPAQTIQPVEMEAEERSQERVVGGEVGEISTATRHHHSPVPQTPPHAQMPSPLNQTD